MEWTDEGLIIGLRRHGETSVIVELMTRAHGRHMGIVKGGRSRRQQPALQPGNSVSAVWRARLEEHLGTFAIDLTAARAAGILDSALALAAIGHIGELLRLLPERDPHPGLYEMAVTLADRLADAGLTPALMVRFELAVLAELGFGLDLGACAATGARANLIYVSPKSGRAVSAEAGAPWADRMLPLPEFLLVENWGVAPPPDAVAAGFRLTGYFLERDLFSVRHGGLPDIRRVYLAALAKEQARQAGAA